jgi:glycosyltransferase involved in cell wall biosynthesis
VRILHIITALSASTGGPAEACLGLCRELAKRGHEVSIYTTNFEQSDDEQFAHTPRPLDAAVYDHGVEIRYFAATGRGRFYASSLPLLRALYRKIPAVDIVHIHSIYLFHSTVGAFLCRHFDVPYVIKPHGTLDPYLRGRHRMRKWLHELLVERQTFKSAAAIQFTAIQEMTLATESRAGKRLFNRTVGAIVPNGVVIPEAFEPAAAGEDVEGLIEQFPELRGKRIVLFLSRINFKKGLDILVAAFARLSATHRNLHLLLAGPDNEGFGQKVKEWIMSANVADRVTFPGMLRGAYKNAAFKLAEIFVLPSYSENFGIAIVEAMSYGLPVVVSDKVNIWEEISDAAAGLVIKCDAAELEPALASLLGDPELRRAMGERGRQLVHRTFTWEVAGRQMSDLYEQILQEHLGPRSAGDGRAAQIPAVK